MRVATENSQIALQLREPEQAVAPVAGRISDEEFEAALVRLAAYSDKIPMLPDEAFSRESIYSDHD